MAPRVIPIATVAGGKAAPGLAVPPPLALYVHFPWCARKCPYCDFNSHEARGAVPEREYLAALVADLDHALPGVWGRTISSVFIGGGTPSLLAAETVDALLSAVRARLPLQPGAEVTLEANPGSAESGRFAGYRAAGVTRLSLGVQSFDGRHLAALGRIHDAHEARRGVELALRHFDNVNLDLMYALPGQTLDEARADIGFAAALGAAHLSAYHLTLEPNTAFHRAPPPLPDADEAAAMQDVVEEALDRAGYRHYEVAAFARPGSECRHNLNYWTFGDYLGIGAGAHGKLSQPEGIRRETRQRHPQAYLEAAAGGAVQEARLVAAADLPFEFMMNALRLTGGFAPALFAERTGLSLESIRTLVDAAVADGLLEADAKRIAPSAQGRHFLNDLLQRFLPEPDR